MNDDNPLAPVLADAIADLRAAAQECDAYRELAQQAIHLLSAVRGREWWIDFAQMRRQYDRDRRGNA